jgi:acetyltransferase-like isoleucine patch superfamily enzyme
LKDLIQVILLRNDTSSSGGGNNVTVKSGVYLWDGIEVRDNVFIGPNVTFTNDKRPRSKQRPPTFLRTIIEESASIGAGAIILGGSRIGAFTMIGAGALVTKNVPSRALVVGIPARIEGWLNEDGSKMIKKGDFLIDNSGARWKINNNELIHINE